MSDSWDDEEGEVDPQFAEITSHGGNLQRVFADDIGDRYDADIYGSSLEMPMEIGQSQECT